MDRHRKCLKKQWEKINLPPLPILPNKLFVRILLIISGSISLALGFIGLFLPLLPTVPFVLLSAALFAKSSPRLYNWLLKHRLFGEHIRNYRAEKAIPLPIKILAISMLWTSILLTIFFVAREKWWLQLMLTGIATAVTIHIISIKTKKKTGH